MYPACPIRGFEPVCKIDDRQILNQGAKGLLIKDKEKPRECVTCLGMACACHALRSCIKFLNCVLDIALHGNVLLAPTKDIISL